MNRQAVLYGVVAGVGAIGASVGLCWLGRKLMQIWRSRHSDIDEWGDEETVSAFMRFHYSPADEVMAYSFGPKGSLDFPKRLAEQCIKHMTEGVLSRALDVGCGPGGVSFELARGFSEVVGLDYSQGFVSKCQQLKMTGQAEYWLPVEGSLREERTAHIDTSIDRSRVQFTQGDACNLPELGLFGCVLAANLITRIPEPMKFLSKMPDIIVPGGILVIASHYIWDEAASPKEKWLGGYLKDGREVRSFDGLKQVLQTNFDLVEAVEVPFMNRESARMYYWGVDHTTVWRRKS